MWIMSSTHTKMNGTVNQWPVKPYRFNTKLIFHYVCRKAVSPSGVEGQSIPSLHFLFREHITLLLLSAITVKYWHNLDWSLVDNDHIIWRLLSKNQFHKQWQWYTHTYIYMYIYIYIHLFAYLTYTKSIHYVCFLCFMVIYGLSDMNLDLNKQI